MQGNQRSRVSQAAVIALAAVAALAASEPAWAASTLPEFDRAVNWLAGIVDRQIVRTVGTAVVMIAGLAVVFGYVRSQRGLMICGGLMVAGAAPTIVAIFV